MIKLIRNFAVENVKRQSFSRSLSPFIGINEVGQVKR